MSASRGNPSDDHRGQSSVLGVLLLVAIVSVSATGVVLVGSQSVAQTKDTVETERVKGGFQSLDKNLDTVARTSGGSRTVDLSIDGSRGAVRREDTGRITVTTDNRTVPIVNRTIGSITYTTDEGEKFSYQAGAVFSGTGQSAQLVSQPDLEYRDETLTLPIVVVDGDKRLTDNRVQITKNVTPLRSDIQLLENEFLTMTITSEYYVGWAQYFKGRTNGVAVSVDHANETVTVDLGRAEADGDFSEGVTATGDVNVGGGSAEIEGDVSATGSIDSDAVAAGYSTQSGLSSTPSPIDSVIDRKVETADNNPSNVTEVDPDLGNVGDLQGGTTYYAPNGIDLDGVTKDVDLAGGNVTLIVDGDIELTSSNVVVDNGNDGEALRIYTTGNLGMKNSGVCYVDCADSDAAHIQTYGTSEMQIAMWGGSTTYEGTIYAPREDEYIGDNAAYTKNNGKCYRTGGDDYDTCIATGSSHVYGAIVAGSMTVSQGVGLTYDSSLAGVEPVLTQNGELLPPDLTYLHVAVYKVDVESEK